MQDRLGWDSKQGYIPFGAGEPTADLSAWGRLTIDAWLQIELEALEYIGRKKKAPGWMIRDCLAYLAPYYSKRLQGVWTHFRVIL